MRRSDPSWVGAGALRFPADPRTRSPTTGGPHAGVRRSPRRRARRPRAAAGRPRGVRRPGPRAAGSTSGMPRWPHRRGIPRVGARPPTTSRPPASWPREDEAFAAEVPGARGAPSPRPRTGCAGCSSRATPTTTATSSSRSRRGRAARSRRCSPATCCGCTCATPSAAAGSTEVIDATESDLGGYKDVQVAVKAKGTPAAGRRARGRG